MNRGNIVLIGLAGTGKSTVGSVLAERTGFRFVDTDSLIEEHAGMSIPAIFALWGEPLFRELESVTIAEVMTRRGFIVATGGGAVLAGINRREMSAHGFVVALTATADAIIERVRDDVNRPLYQGDVAERVRSMMEQRKDAYDFADLTVDTTNRTIEDIARLIHESFASA